jgi:Ca2+-binding RTX toxin-like protein
MAKPIGNGNNDKSSSFLDKTWVASYDGTWDVSRAGPKDRPTENALDGNDFFYITGTGIDYSAAGPTIDGGNGADQLILTEDANIADDFFTHMSSITVLKLADGDGSEVNLSDEALETGIKEVTGGNGDDTVAFTDAYDDTDVMVEGGAGDDTITTAGGDDTIDGGEGDATITGGAGADHLTGGAGNDIFVYGSGDTGDLTFDDVDEDGVLSDGDLITGAFDVLHGFETDSANGTYKDLLDILVVNEFDAEGDIISGLEEDEYQVIFGTYSTSTGFEVDASGEDTLIAFDDGGTDVAIVLIGVTNFTTTDLLTA